jgi:hypothetical protein
VYETTADLMCQYLPTIDCGHEISRLVTEILLMFPNHSTN